MRKWELREPVIASPRPEQHFVDLGVASIVCEEIARRYWVRVTKGMMEKWLRRTRLKGWFPYLWAPIGSRPTVRDNGSDSVYR